MLLVEHTHCAEHGALVHGGEGHGHADGTSAEADRASLEAIPTAPAEEAHEHCAQSTDRRDAIVGVVDAQILTRSDEISQRFFPYDDVAAFEQRRFRLAPKNSPPV